MLRLVTFTFNYGVITKMAKHRAQWSMSLDCICPKCDHYFDLLQADEDFFNSGSGIEAIEHDTARSKDYEVSCPECEHEFEVDFEW